MKLTQVKGNTYVFEGWELIPIYKLDDSRCILLDTGLPKECLELDNSLMENGLTPVGIFGTHAHGDHTVNNSYFQKKYHLPVALPVGEAGLCSSLFTLKAYFYMYSPNTTLGIVENMILDTDVLIGRSDGPVEFMGATFNVLHTPGHSPDHISIITDDDVCYVGDALLSGKMLRAKIPYNFAHQAALESYDLLLKLTCDKYILAHRGVYDDLTELAGTNRDFILERAELIRSLVTQPMNESEIIATVCEHYTLLTSKTLKSAMMERNVHSFIEYLLDRGDLEEKPYRGIRYYCQKGCSHLIPDPVRPAEAE